MFNTNTETNRPMLDTLNGVYQMNDLIHKVVKQIRREVERGELEALYVMLEHLPDDVLAAYLPEE